MTAPVRPATPADARRLATAPGTTPAARRLQLTRVSYGVALVMAPGLVIYLATGRFPSRRARRVAQLLGTRHLAQAAIAAAVPVPDVFALGAAVDTAHAASMLMLVPAGRAAWRAALLDALAEAVFAAAGRGWAPRTGAGTKRGRGK